MIRKSLRAAKIFATVGVAVFILSAAIAISLWSDTSSFFSYIVTMVIVPIAALGVIASLATASVVKIREHSTQSGLRVVIFAPWVVATYLASIVVPFTEAVENTIGDPFISPARVAVVLFGFLAAATLLIGWVAAIRDFSETTQESGTKTKMIWAGTLLVVVGIFYQTAQVQFYHREATRADFWEAKVVTTEQSRVADRASVCLEFEGAHDLLDSIEHLTTNQLAPVSDSATEVLIATDEAREQLQSFDLNYCLADAQHVREVVHDHAYYQMPGDRGELLSDPVTLRSLGLEEPPPELHKRPTFPVTPAAVREMRQRADAAKQESEVAGDERRAQQSGVDAQGHDLVMGAISAVQDPLSAAAQDVSEQVITASGGDPSEANDLAQLARRLGKVEPTELLEHMDDFTEKLTQKR